MWNLYLFAFLILVLERKTLLHYLIIYYFDLTFFVHKEILEAGAFPWSCLKELHSYLISKPLGLIKGSISPAAHLVNEAQISIGEGSVVEPGAYIQGPCIIGKNCTIRHGAYLRGNVLTGDHCVIGHDTEVKNAIFLNHAHAAHFAYVGDSIVGNYVNLGAGVKCANFRLDGKTIDIQLNGEKIPTQMRKLGALVGDKTQIGCNTVINPGTLIGQEVLCHPCLNIEKFIPSRSLLKSPSKPLIIPY